MEQSDIDLLHTVPPYHLQSLLKLRRPKGQTTGALTTSSTTALDEAAQQLFQSSAIAEALHSLNDTEGLILRELVACGGRANSRDLALYLSSSRVIGANKATDQAFIEQSSTLYPAPHPHGVFEQSLRRLLMLGLLFWGKQTNFAGRDYTSGVYDGVLIVPQAVKDSINANLRAEKMSQSTQALFELEQVGEGVHTFQRQLYLYWSHVSTLREGLPLVGSGLLSRTALRQVVELLGPKGQIDQIRTEQDVPRLLFIRLLLMKLGLLRERQNALYVASPDDFFGLPVLERLCRCYSLWLETSFWNELAFLPDVIVRPGPAPLEAAHEEVARARHMLMERIVVEPIGRWCDVPAFIARTKLYKPYLLFPRQYGARADRYSQGNNPYGWDFRLRRGWLTHREGWHMVEGGFIRAVVLGPLHWLGLVDVRTEKSGVAFCPVPAMVVVTNKEALPVQDVPWGRLIVQPNFELVALAPVSEALLIKLDSFAERVGLEHIAQYRMTKASIMRAIQLGLQAETIQQILTEAAGGVEIPQNVQYSLIEWERQARRIELWQDVALLEVEDPALLDLLFTDEQAQAWLKRRLSPVLAEVAQEQLPAIQRILWQRNYLPALTAAPAQDELFVPGHPEGNELQWRLHEDGSLEPLYAVSDLYLVAQIERVSELDTLTGWRKITPRSIEQACSNGLELDAIIRFLQHYCEGGIPSSFLIRLKLWGKGYGEADSIEVERAPMLYLAAQVLEDIQADETLQPLLGSEVPQQGRLVRVPAENLEQVIALLRERGFDVE
ncbi:MAG TPA: helicase-associated domain-containing protein [Ktedonobacteraceae bacterium]|nr:helicase-associated domain-containing protein [Ktedonobacteraceae bacterium]